MSTTTLVLRGLQFASAATLIGLAAPLSKLLDTEYNTLPSEHASSSTMLVHALLAVSVITLLYTPVQPILRVLKKHALLDSALLCIMTAVNDVLLSLAYLLLASYSFIHLVLPIADLPRTVDDPTANNYGMVLPRAVDTDGWAPLPRPGGELRPTIDVKDVGSWAEGREMRLYTQGLGLGRAAVGVALAVGVWFVVSAWLAVMGVLVRRREEAARRAEAAAVVEEKNRVADDARSVAESV